MFYKIKKLLIIFMIFFFTIFNHLFAGVKVYNKPNKIYGVIVGINEYADKNINLKYCVNDATSLFNELNNNDSEFYLLTNKKATREKILGRIDKILQKVKKKDLIILYFAAHGAIKYNDFFIFPHGSSWNNILGTCIPSRTIINALSSKTGKGINILFILDTCHAGGIGFDISKFYDPINKGGCAMVLSSSPLEFSGEAKKYGGGHGLFTYYLIKGLQGAADLNGNKVVTIREWFDYTYSNVKKETSDAQNPVLIGTIPNNLIIKSFLKLGNLKSKNLKLENFLTR